MRASPLLDLGEGQQWHGIDDTRDTNSVVEKMQYTRDGVYLLYMSLGNLNFILFYQLVYISRRSHQHSA